MKQKEFERMKKTLKKGDIIKLNFKSSILEGELVGFVDNYFIVTKNLFRFNYKRVTSLEVLNKKTFASNCI